MRAAEGALLRAIDAVDELIVTEATAYHRGVAAERELQKLHAIRRDYVAALDEIKTVDSDTAMPPASDDPERFADSAGNLKRRSP